MQWVQVISYEQYTAISPYEIWMLENQKIQKSYVFVLSAFPEFLLDYFGVKLWKTCVKHKQYFSEKYGC